MANRVLIISPDTEDTRTLRRSLGHARDGPFDVESVFTLAQGVERIRQGGIDAILADLTLPDNQGLACFDQLHAAARHVPILTLCDLDDEADAKEAVQRGAQGWLSRGYFDNYLVPQSLRNIIERTKVEQRLYVAMARAEITLNSIGDAVISTDMTGCVDYLNAAAELITGWSRKKAHGRPIAEVLDIVDGVTRRQVVNPVEYVLQSDRATGLTSDAVLVGVHGKCIPIEDSAAPIHDWDGKIVGAVMVFRDISNAVALMSKMRHQAQHDFLTKLPNRILLNDRISQAIASARRNNANPALLFLDLDKFKHINDSLGHAVGDQLLQAVSERLVNCVRASDTVSRHGGDEFVILLADERQPHDAALAAEKILLALSTPFLIEGQQLHTSTSIGISVFPLDGMDAAALIKNADTAMYHAKEHGRNNYQFFSHDMNTRAVERQLIENNLRRALESHEFRLHYQPKVDLKTNRITGVEALLRWEHPEWGLVLPERFIMIAEECGLIIPIGRWVLNEACEQAVRWRNEGISPVSIAVNVSALEFRHRDFFEHALAILQTTGVDPTCLQLELTESVLMRDVATSATLLAQFKAMGVQIAVDDFGTGYSSLSYLNQFPIDVLKIDQSFVRAIDTAQDSDGGIVSAVIGMGKNLNQRVIAEGVEDAGQFAFLDAHGCNEGQGYFFSKPVNAGQMQAMLNTGACI
ncbi:EAL domain-containing protein [Massilia pinisoli]|uniref:EAL domain-containing protein n=1 Tax=Massilia pinisoli TaxID=1772194 RepID=A0ABT1ZWG1_9BURK|nr:EAL domain-containing protein [Massilia pinisoli]MCS0584214.1 EAL domain-containing protein [Massilia pinisoli]